MGLDIAPNGEKQKRFVVVVVIDNFETLINLKILLSLSIIQLLFVIQPLYACPHEILTIS